MSFQEYQTMSFTPKLIYCLKTFLSKMIVHFQFSQNLSFKIAFLALATFIEQLVKTVVLKQTNNDLFKYIYRVY